MDGRPAPSHCDHGSNSTFRLCQHRWNPVVGLLGFHNTVGSDALNNWVSGGSQQIAFGRGTYLSTWTLPFYSSFFILPLVGSSGFVVINNADSTWSTTFTTSLPDGTYCDVYAGPLSGTSCTGSSYTVSGGRVSLSVGARTACALHIGAKPGGSSTSTTTTSLVTTATTTTSASPTTTSSSGSVTVTFSVYATTNFGQVISFMTFKLLVWLTQLRYRMYM
jgi:hypothetical protein